MGYEEEYIVEVPKKHQDYFQKKPVPSHRLLDITEQSQVTVMRTLRCPIFIQEAWKKG
jgi:hypothetical protein